ncbi:MAG: hypothetical protein PHT16_03155 [Candidatus Pacebacteria bacterium]|nr:hypothetical protein [Candidatus Paceibacterota bacterium]
MPTSVPTVPFEQVSLLIRHMEAQKGKNEEGMEKIKKEAEEAGFKIE